MAQMAELVIQPPIFQVAEFTIRGTAAYVQNCCSAQARTKDGRQAYEAAMHCAEEGWHGIPAPALRNAMISACQMTGFAPTRAKLIVFIVADGIDRQDATPLVRITKGEPECFERATRNESGVIEIRPLPVWRAGWEAVVRVRFDADQFTWGDVANLLVRAGVQVGIGEGRPDGGTFELVS